eukprot:ctg_248.g135
MPPDPGVATPPAGVGADRRCAGHRPLAVRVVEVVLVVHHDEMHRALVDGVPQRIRRGAAFVHRPVQVGADVRKVPRSFMIAAGDHVRLLRGQRLQQLHELVGAPVVAVTVRLVARQDHVVELVHAGLERVKHRLAALGANVGEKRQLGGLGGVAVRRHERVAHVPRRARNRVGVVVARRQAAHLDVARIPGPAGAEKRRQARALRRGTHIGGAVLLAAAAAADAARRAHVDAAAARALLRVVGDDHLARVAGHADVHVVRIQRVVRVTALAGAIVLRLKPGALDQRAEEERRLTRQVRVEREDLLQFLQHCLEPLALRAGPHEKGLQRHREHRIFALYVFLVQIIAKLAEGVLRSAAVLRHRLGDRPASDGEHREYREEREKLGEAHRAS